MSKKATVVKDRSQGTENHHCVEGQIDFEVACRLILIRVKEREQGCNQKPEGVGPDLSELSVIIVDEHFALYIS